MSPHWHSLPPPTFHSDESTAIPTYKDNEDNETMLEVRFLSPVAGIGWCGWGAGIPRDQRGVYGAWGCSNKCSWRELSDSLEARVMLACLWVLFVSWWEGDWRWVGDDLFTWIRLRVVMDNRGPCVFPPPRIKRQPCFELLCLCNIVGGLSFSDKVAWPAPVNTFGSNKWRRWTKKAHAPNSNGNIMSRDSGDVRTWLIDWLEVSFLQPNYPSFHKYTCNSFRLIVKPFPLPGSETTVGGLQLKQSKIIKITFATSRALRLGTPSFSKCSTASVWCLAVGGIAYQLAL